MYSMKPEVSRLRLSLFSGRFRLQEKELKYLRDKRMAQALKHAADFIEKRLAPATLPNDGNKTL